MDDDYIVLIPIAAGALTSIFQLVKNPSPKLKTILGTIIVAAFFIVTGLEIKSIREKRVLKKIAATEMANAKIDSADAAKSRREVSEIHRKYVGGGYSLFRLIKSPFKDTYYGQLERVGSEPSYAINIQIVSVADLLQCQMEYVPEDNNKLRIDADCANVIADYVDLAETQPATSYDIDLEKFSVHCVDKGKGYLFYEVNYKSRGMNVWMQCIFELTYGKSRADYRLFQYESDSKTNEMGTVKELQHPPYEILNYEPNWDAEFPIFKNRKTFFFTGNPKKKQELLYKLAKGREKSKFHP